MPVSPGDYTAVVIPYSGLCLKPTVIFPPTGAEDSDIGLISEENPVFFRAGVFRYAYFTIVHPATSD
ncbi:hypothetical protein GCM10023116_16210 [Kistimonas scapharcae]|uniref:Uncharacterized protein n=1 Tax=Kistimonas scapharcae TaxID=1036133 RepID=A0ABP8V0E9_9GAMM